MGNNSSSGYGHSFLDFFKSAGDFFKATTGTLFEGDTSGWGSFANDWKNYGQDVAQTFTNKSFNRFGGAAPTDQSFISSGSRIQSTTGTTQGTANPSANSSSRTVNATYSSGGLGGTSKPSSLNAISDPTTKMAIATSRGSQRAQVNNVNNNQDLAAAPALSSASSAPSTTPP